MVRIIISTLQTEVIKLSELANDIYHLTYLRHINLSFSSGSTSELILP